jgi:hypothetical protein
MSVDFMVMGRLSSILPKEVLTMCFTRIEMDDPSKERLDSWSGDIAATSHGVTARVIGWPTVVAARSAAV